MILLLIVECICYDTFSYVVLLEHTEVDTSITFTTPHLRAQRLEPTRYSEDVQRVLISLVYSFHSYESASSQSSSTNTIPTNSLATQIDAQACPSASKCPAVWNDQFNACASRYSRSQSMRVSTSSRAAASPTDHLHIPTYLQIARASCDLDVHAVVRIHTKYCSSMQRTLPHQCSLLKLSRSCKSSLLRLQSHWLRFYFPSSAQ